METKESQEYPVVFLVSGAGSTDVNGVYRNLDGSSNNGSLNYQMKNSSGRTFGLYYNQSEDQRVRNWILKEQDKENFYKAVDNVESPQESDWILDGIGKEPTPNVHKIPRDLEHELKTRLSNFDLLSTLDLSAQYQKWCKPSALKKLYIELWNELPKEIQEAARAESKKKKKPVKKKTIERKITLTVQLGHSPCNGRRAKSFNMMITFNTSVLHLMDNIAKQVNKEPGKAMELMYNGNKILSKLAAINKLGIERGSTIVVLGVKPELQKKGVQIMTDNKHRIKKAYTLPPLEESEDGFFQEEPEKKILSREIETTEKCKLCIIC